MKASNIFKIFVRSLMVIFMGVFLYNLILKAPNRADYKEKIKNLQLDNTVSQNATWLSSDQNLASAHLKESKKKLIELDSEHFKKEIKTAKALIAEDTQSTLYVEIEKTEKAFENIIVLRKNLETMTKKNQKFVRLISKNNPMVLGHIVEENADFVSIKDQDGFIIPIHKKNIVSMTEIDSKEKNKIYSELLAKVMDDNGKTSSYGLFLSAKWAYENDLEDKVNSILAEAVLSDSQILLTIADNESKKILSLAKWSNLMGDFEDAKEKAQLVIQSYSQTEQFGEAQKELALAIENIGKAKLVAERKESKPNENELAQLEQTNTDFAKAPLITEKEKDVVVVPEVTETPKPKNTLTLRTATNEEVNKSVLTKQPEKEKVDEGDKVEEKLGGKENKNPLKNALFEDKNYQEASVLVNEGKNFMKKANSYENPGNKNAQANFKLALGKFQEAIEKLNRISKKFNGKEDFDDLYGQASGMEFFIKKSCLRLK